MSIEKLNAAGRFWKGNLHMHSTSSDGCLTPREICHAYHQAGYDFLCISDHFLACYDWPITDAASEAPSDLTLLIGAEIHAPANSHDELWHILAVGLPTAFAPPSPEERMASLAQRCLDAGAFVTIAHPEWSGLCARDAESVPGAHAVEVYNHTSALHAARGGGAYYLDLLLTAGRRINALACDDAHFNIPDRPMADAFGAWVMVRAENNTPHALLAALKEGAYYSTRGPDFRSISLDGDSVEIACSPVAHIALLGRGSRVERLHGNDLTDARLPLQRFRGDWARIVLTDSLGREAWSNPFWP